MSALIFSTACFEDVKDDVGGADGSGTTSGDGDSGDGDSGDGDGDPGDGDGDGDTANDDSDMCEPGDICVDDAIAGWDGPLVIFSGPVDVTPPACQGGVPVKVAELFTELEMGQSPQTCACECGGVNSATCGAVTLRQSKQQACFTTADTWMVGPDDCADLGGAQGEAYYAVNEPDLLELSCDASYAQELVPAAHGVQILACSTDGGAQQCGANGVCMPPADAPFDGRVCIAAEGDVQCPGGSYSDRYVYYTGLDDGRSCGACACDKPPNATCSGDVRLMGQGCGIQGFLLGSVEVGGCSASVSNVGYADFAPASPDDQVGCIPSGGGVDGEVEELGATTFCCQ
ncbi:hypothetical protein ENSA5_20370 [Enhygromyxa salina]|uniref:Uncharacterized protein n=2 Tax=Enhygromyxa salina TaxID=215803 RepID=A0A2S9YCL7_9BACT|nr:hypothetical protein ENSA5_20370 [Enhygromyxa salina]